MREITPQIREIYTAEAKRRKEHSLAWEERFQKLKDRSRFLAVCWGLICLVLLIPMILFSFGWLVVCRLLPFSWQAKTFGRTLGQFQTKKWGTPLLDFPWQTWLLLEYPKK